MKWVRVGRKAGIKTHPFANERPEGKEPRRNGDQEMQKDDCKTRKKKKKGSKNQKH